MLTPCSSIDLHIIYNKYKFDAGIKFCRQMFFFSVIRARKVFQQHFLLDERRKIIGIGKRNNGKNVFRYKMDIALK